MKKFELHSFASADELARAAAGTWLDEMESAHRAGRRHCVALSGGRITKSFFAAVVEQAKVRKIGDGGAPALPGNIHFFWADERCVPPDDPESNFRMADELLFRPLKIPESQIHRLRGEDSPAAAVKMAGEELQKVLAGAPVSDPARFKLQTPDRAGSETGAPLSSRQPILDLILLGMGEDGHVASLFPNAPAEVVNCPSPFLFIDHSPKPPPRRISLSYAAIGAAKQVWVLISGAGKGQALRKSLDFPVKTPLGRVLQLRQKTLIFSQIEGSEII